MSSSTANMMDFDNILDIASQNQGLSSVQKRYSLQAGPPKKDPKSKGVNPAAVQALLKKRQIDTKQKELESKKQKEQLLAKRVELKSDRKARAMASRTKDNFKGYNGIPVVETPKKRGSKGDKQEDHPDDPERFRNNAIDPLDDEDNYEYEQTDSEGEPEPEMMRPQKTMSVSGPSKLVSKKNSGPPKPPPPAMNFADLLRLAEKKQFEPVELKPKVKKEERLRTAEEIRELEMERKAKRPDKSRDSKVDGGREGRSLSTSSSVRKSTTEKEPKHNKLQRNSTEKPSLPGRSGNKVQSAGTSDRGLSFSKPSVSDKERNREKTPHSDRERSKMGISASSVATVSKNPSKAHSSQVSAKHVSSRMALTQKPSTSSDLSSRKDSLSLHQKGASCIQGNRHSNGVGAGQRSQHATSQQTRPIQGSSLKQGSIAGEMKSNRGDPQRSGNNPLVRSNGNSLRPSLGGPSKAGNQCQGRPMGIPQNKPGGAPQNKPGGAPQNKPGGAPQSRPGRSGPERGGSRPPGPFRPGSGGQVSGRPNSNLGSGPGRPKCTVVSETISSKNVGGPRPGVSPRPGMQQRPGVMPGMRPGVMPGMRPGVMPGMRPGMMPGIRPGMMPGIRPGIPPRPMMNRPPGTMLPPITIAYKRKYEDEEEEYDPEMDDFIDDGGEEQDEISRHIKEIFGYDRNRYKDESDYALKFMESSWKDLQKEEARSLRMAVQEDLEEERREEEELKRKKAKRKKIN
ncbi:PREDICTED: protein SPT2 homolog [Poecilia mexicana]|uniref:Protein SPT2 homolog n=1 Tax=Poecilia mexicana TaxID=48701 RepID=A0A3B3X4Z7_9TELE|nr:PREDICTED: protein SPT2 homolog [Poecilia mexicana]